MPQAFSGTELGQGPLGQPTLSVVPRDTEGEPEVNESRAAQVKRWVDNIKKDKAFWKDDFDRMKHNMEFVAGLQYSGQNKIQEERYIANWTIQRINQKVATLYARDPQVTVKPRKRLDFQLWDGKMETVQQAAGAAMGSLQQMGMVPPEAMAMLNDYQQGRQIEEMCQRVGETLTLLFQFEMDTQEPNFKVQAKQWVRRVCVCGVGYIKVLFCRDYSEPTHSETTQSTMDRVKNAQEILQKIADGKTDSSDADMQRLQDIIASLNMSPLDHEKTEMKERLVFDFPPATSIIPDRQCRILKGFIGAKYITEEFLYSIDEINARYGTNIKAGGDIKAISADNREEQGELRGLEADKENTPKSMIYLWQVHNLEDKTSFIVCEGYKDYVEAPQPVTPAPSSFWTIFPLTFNDVETEPTCKNSIFPPSDVDLMMSPQKEWNRTRQALREQRRANAPKYMCRKGTLSENDKTAILMAADNQVIELENLEPGQDPSKAVVALQVAPIDRSVYDTAPLEQDTMLVSAQQEANIGAAQPNVTATVGSIAEHSRQTIAASNVDDLDDCLTAVARCGGELLLMEMSPETVTQIVGVGAVFPAQSRQTFLSEVQLQIEAGSSGRPNKAIELDNFSKLMPILIQMGANPQAIIREGIKRLDDRLDPADFFPIGGPGPMGPPPEDGQPAVQGPQGPQGPPKQIGPPDARGQEQMYPAHQQPMTQR